MAALSRSRYPDLPDAVVPLAEVGADPNCVPGPPCDTLRAAIAQQGGQITEYRQCGDVLQLL